MYVEGRRLLSNNLISEFFLQIATFLLIDGATCSTRAAVVHRTHTLPGEHPNLRRDSSPNGTLKGRDQFHMVSQTTRLP